MNEKILSPFLKRKMGLSLSSQANLFSKRGEIMRIRIIKKYLLLLIIFLLPLSLSCGGGGSSSSGGGNDPKYNPGTVSFDMSDSNDWVKCNDASNILNRTYTTFRATDCRWFCGNGYKNANNSLVWISFYNEGSGWYIAHDSISKGMCN